MNFILGHPIIHHEMYIQSNQDEIFVFGNRWQEIRVVDNNSFEVDSKLIPDKTYK